MYCGNQFWYMYQNQLRLLWPFEFRDCYIRNVETGSYSFSPFFEGRVKDIKSWTMGPGFFKQFPELYSDIPTSDTIPAQVSNFIGMNFMKQGQQKDKRPAQQLLTTYAHREEEQNSHHGQPQLLSYAESSMDSTAMGSAAMGGSEVIWSYAFDPMSASNGVTSNMDGMADFSAHLDGNQWRY